MIGNIKEEIKKLENTNEFRKFKKGSPDSYLYAAFSMYETKEDGKWQFNYLNPKDKKTTTFELGAELKISQPSDIFQKEKSEPKKIDIDKIKIDLDKAFLIFNEIKKKEYNDLHENRFIIVLQVIDNIQLWNLTYLTSELRFINIKINSSSGEVIEKKSDSILSLKAN